ncbi:adenylosuccinate synthase [Thalassospira profundimaris]|uniref:adenylosuccinate synthase n=1 Tax=Thalassospira profundimaris TaxID=502049 RepID=UPI000DED4089|nr:adenylosuccinate synthase [Thalassospira profundimaris]
MTIVRRTESLATVPADLQERTLSEHDRLCEVARKWLLRAHSSRGLGCNLALREISSIYGGESPDVLGYRASGPWSGTYLVEVKTSRPDFLADRKKGFRADPSIGVGDWRFYLCPEGLISPADLPEKWGLIWVNSRGHIKPQLCLHIENSPHRKEHRAKVEAMRFAGNRDHELLLFLSALRNNTDAQEVLDRKREQQNLVARLSRSLADAKERCGRLEGQLQAQARQMRELAEHVRKTTGTAIPASFGI